jgi:hypothetical protein
LTIHCVVLHLFELLMKKEHIVIHVSVWWEETQDTLFMVHVLSIQAQYFIRGINSRPYGNW